MDVTLRPHQGPLEDKAVSDLVNLMGNGSTYVNVHTDQYPKGAVRGQISFAEIEAGGGLASSSTGTGGGGGAGGASSSTGIQGNSGVANTSMTSSSTGPEGNSSANTDTASASTSDSERIASDSNQSTDTPNIEVGKSIG